MARSRVHHAGTVFGGHVVRQHRPGIPPVHRVGKHRVLDFASPQRAHGGGVAPAQFLQDALLQVGQHHVVRTLVRHHGVLQLGMERHRQVRGNRPWGRRPNHAVHGLQPGEDAVWVGLEREPHVDAAAHIVLVDDLGIRQSRAAGRRPQHRAQAPVDVATLHQPLKHADDFCLVGELHRGVGVIPRSQDPEPRELRGLQRDVLLGVGAAGLA